MRSVHRFFVACFLVAVSCFTFVAHAGQDPEVSVREMPRAWSTQSSIPYYIDVRSRRGGEIRITAISEGFGKNTVYKTVSVPPNASLRLEMTAPDGQYSTVSCEGSGLSVREHLSHPGFDGRNLSGVYPSPLLCVNSFLLRELELLDPADTLDDMSSANMVLDEMPTRWQSYSGMVGVLVMEAREAKLLKPAQREALTIWVRWLGGRLWLGGSDAEATAKELGFDLSRFPKKSSRGVTRYQVLNGVVCIQPRPDAAELVANLPSGVNQNPLEAYYHYKSYYDESTAAGNWLLESFAGISTNVIIGALIVLGVAMGPLNYWFIRRRKKMLLFFVTTPVIACLGTVCIIVASLLSEGIGGSYAQFAVLARDEAGEDAMLYDLRGVKSGFSAPQPRFSEDSLVFPIRGGGYGERRELTTDLTDGVRLVGGWLLPRFPCGFGVVRPAVGRMGVDVEMEDGRPFVVNNLGFNVKRVAARLADGSVVWAEAVAPGARAALNQDASGLRLQQLDERLRLLADNKKAFSDACLIAECDGLPYLDDGGVSASRVKGEYYFCLVGTACGEGRP